LERQGKRRDSLQEDKAREEVETSKKEKRLGTVQLLAAGQLHSSLTSEQIKQLSVTLTDNIQSKESGTIRPLARVVVQEPVKLVFDHDGGHSKDEYSDSEYPDQDNVDGEHYLLPNGEEHRQRARNSARGNSGSFEACTTNVVDMVRASMKPNVYTSKRSVGKDSVMPGSIWVDG
jgi:hypothetical protein